MPTSQSQLTEILREQIKGLEERCPGYRARAADALARIIVLENQNRIKPMAIRQEVKRQCLELGTFLAAGIRTEAQGTTPPEETDG
jgi:hypothetical protein